MRVKGVKTEEEYFAEIEAGRMTPREVWAQMNVDGWVEEGWSQELQDLMLPHILSMWDRGQDNGEETK